MQLESTGVELTRSGLGANGLEASFLGHRSAGNQKELARVVHSVHSELMRVAMFYLQRYDVAEDVVQATTLAAVEGCQRFRADHRLKPWLCGILLNKIAAHRRAYGRTYRELGVNRSKPVDPLDAAQNSETKKLVAQALQQLPKHYREVLVLRLEQGFSNTEIADRLQRSESTVRNQIMRGLIRLRDLLPQGLAGFFMLPFGRAGRPTKGKGIGTLAAAGTPLLSVTLLLAILAVVGVWSGIGSHAAEALGTTLAGEVSPDELLVDGTPANVMAPVRTLSAVRPGLSPTSVDPTSAMAGFSGLTLALFHRNSGAPASGAKATAEIIDRAGVHHAWSGQSDSNGRLRIDFLATAMERLELKVGVGEQARVHALWDRSSTSFRSEEPLELGLSTQRPVSGRFVDQQGVPVAGVKIKLLEFRLHNNSEWSEIGGMEALSDAQGNWRMDAALDFPTRFKFVVLHPDYIPYATRGHASPERVAALWEGSAVDVLERGRRLNLSLTDASGNPIQGAQARLIDARDPPLYIMDIALDRGARGRFTLPSVDRFCIQASAPGFSLTTRAFKVHEIGESVSIPLDRTQAREIRVLDERLEPVEGALLRMFGSGEREWVMSGADGRVTLDLKESKLRYLSVGRVGVLGEVGRLLRPSDTEIILPTALELRLHVRDALTSEALVGYTLGVWSLAGRAMGKLRLADVGEIELVRTNSDPSGLVLEIQLQGYHSKLSAPLIGAQGVLDVTLDLEPAETLELDFRRPDGTQVEFLTLLLVGEGVSGRLANGSLGVKRSLGHAGLRHVRGRVSINRPARAFTLFACGEDGFLQVEGSKLLEAATLRLQPWACVEGTLLGGGSVRLESTSKHLHGLDLNYEVEVDAGGQFHFCEVPSGSIGVTTSPGEARVEIEAVAGEVTSVVL